MEHLMEVFRDNKWLPCSMKELKLGETFRVYEKEDRILYVGRAAHFVAAADPIQRNGKWYLEIINPEDIMLKGE